VCHMIIDLGALESSSLGPDQTIIIVDYSDVTDRLKPTIDLSVTVKVQLNNSVI
jgi:hypothetical protein